MEENAFRQLFKVKITFEKMSENLEPAKKKEKRRVKKREKLEDIVKEQSIVPIVQKTEKTCRFCENKTHTVAFVCECGKNISFENCRNNCSKGNVELCSACEKQYTLGTETKISLSTHRCDKFFDILLGIFTVLCFAFLLAPMDILAATSLKPYLPNQEFHLFKNANPRDDIWMSNLMFPGPNILMITDLFYVIALSLVYFALVCGPFLQQVSIWFSEQRYWKKRYSAPLVISAALLFHVLGNVHYQFWCSVGVIPKENCFMVFNWKSFQMWLSGLIIVAIHLACAVGLVFLFIWLFVTKKQQIVVNAVRKQ